MPDPSTREGSGCEALFEIIRKEGDLWMVSKLVLDHTHELTPAPPSKVRCVRSQGEILVIAKNFADTRSLLLNGHDPALPKEIRYNDLGPDDFDSLLEYFAKIQEENPAFFYAVQIDKKTNRTTNVFWADAQARMAYHYFGDTVRFETRYRNDKELIPLVLFMGLNHHAHPVVFGCGLLVDESEESFAWLFENWISAMPGQRPPLSFVTELSRPIAAAAAGVFPDTCHLFCSEHVLGSISEELPHLLLPDKCENNMDNNTFIEEVKSCIKRSATVEAFESQWVMITERYGLRDNGYTCYLYDIRQQWVPVYTKDAFTGEVSGLYRVPEYLNKVVEKYFTVKTQLKEAVRQLSQAVANWHENEHGADFMTLFENPTLQTASPLEKQAAGIYSRFVFEQFQQEFMQSFGYFTEKLAEECGTQIIRKYRLMHSYDESNEEMHDVTLSLSEVVKVFCTCRKFESCGILCRHSLKVFIVEGIRNLPREYILKRWTKHAKSDFMLDGSFVELKGQNCKYDLAVTRYNSLCADAMRCAKEGSESDELYKVAKEAIQKAYDEVILAKPHRVPYGLSGYMVPQKKQDKASLSGVKSMKRSGSPTSLTDDDMR
jgi:MULE transposase domain/SWIM zinc finger